MGKEWKPKEEHQAVISQKILEKNNYQFFLNR